MDKNQLLAGGGAGLDQIIESLLTGDEDGLPEELKGADLGEVVKQTVAKQKGLMEKDAKLLAKVFWYDPDGRKVLKLLCDTTINARNWAAWEFRDLQMMALHGVGREYQDEFVRELVRVIAERVQSAPVDTEDDDED